MTDMVNPDFRRTHLVLLALNIPVQDYYRQFGISGRLYKEPNQAIAKQLQIDLINEIARGENRPFLGVEMACDPRLNELGVLSYLVRNASTFRQCLELIDSYIELVAPGAHSSFREEEQTCLWIYRLGHFSPAQSRQDSEGTLVQFCQMVRDMTDNKAWLPDEVWFQHTRPQSTELLEQHLCQNLHFDSHHNAIRFPRKLLYFPLQDADPALLDILEKHARDSLVAVSKSDDLVKRVTFLISSRLGKADVSADAIADHLAMTRRTLVRKLAQRDQGFKDIKDNITLTMAKEILATSNASVTEIALQLGYSETSAFNRFFKNKTGLSPTAYKRQQ